MSTVQQIPHGTLDYAEVAALGVHPDDLLVFSSNINPYGPPPAVMEALRHALTPAVIARYPDRLSLDLRARLAAHHHVPDDAVLVDAIPLGATGKMQKMTLREQLKGYKFLN